jgi:hypothetical protein
MIVDLLSLFIFKNVQTELKNNELEKLFKKKIISDNNKLNISRQLYSEINLPNNNKLFNDIQNKVSSYLESWINLGIFDNIEFENVKFSNINELIDYYNKLFVDTFREQIVNYNLMENEINNNPYKHELNINNKNIKYENILSDDYQYINNNNYIKVFTNNRFDERYNKVPYYESALYKRNYDRNEKGSLENHILETYNFKRYISDDLTNNVSYLRKNKK